MVTCPLSALLSAFVRVHRDCLGNDSPLNSNVIATARYKRNCSNEFTKQEIAAHFESVEFDRGVWLLKKWSNATRRVRALVSCMIPLDAPT